MSAVEHLMATSIIAFHPNKVIVLLRYQLLFALRYFKGFI